MDTVGMDAATLEVCDPFWAAIGGKAWSQWVAATGGQAARTATT